MDRIKIASQIVTDLNIAFGNNLPKSAVDVVIEVMKEFDEEESAQQSVQRTANITTSTNATICAKCKSNYVLIGTSVMTCAMCGSTRRRSR